MRAAPPPPSSPPNEPPCSPRSDGLTARPCPRSPRSVKYEGPSLPLPLSNTGLYGLSGELKTGKALSDGAAGENSWEVTYGTQEPKGPLPGVQLTLSGSDADGAKITRPTWSIALMY